MLAVPALAKVESAHAVELGKPLQTLVDTVDQVAGIAGEVSKKGAEVATSAKPFLDQLGPAAARAGKALAPVGDSLGKLGERTLVPAAKQTLGQGEAAVSGALKSLETSLSAQVGFDVPLEKTVSAVAKEAPGVVKATVGVAQSVVQALLSADPITLAEYAVLLYVVSLAAPKLGDVLATSLRGYAGDVRPPQALNSLMQSGGAVLVDIRTRSETNAKGLVDLPGAVAKQLVRLERTQLEQGRQFKNVKGAEAGITAVQVGALKKLNKKSTVLLLDQEGRQAQEVAKALTKLGFKNVLVVDGGFASWMRSQLSTKSALEVTAEPLRRVSAVKQLGSKPRVRAGGRANVVDVEVLPPLGGFLGLPPGK